MSKKKKRVVLFCGMILLGVAIVIPIVSNKSDDNKIWYRKNLEPSMNGDFYDYSDIQDDIYNSPSDERAEASEIPQELLDTMNTSALLITCLEYPLQYHIYMHDSYRKGYEIIRENYNGLSELVERPDAGEVLFNFYMGIQLSEVAKSDEFPATRMTYVNLIASDVDIVKKYTKQQRVGLIQRCVNDIQEYANKYSDLFSMEPLFSFLGRLLYEDNEEFRELAQKKESIQSLVDGNSFGVSQDIYITDITDILDIVDKYYNLTQ